MSDINNQPTDGIEDLSLIKPTTIGADEQLSNRGTPYAKSSINAMPNKITSRHRIIMRLMIGGMQVKAIAEELGYDPARVSIITNSPIFKAEMAELEKQLCDKFTDKVSGADADVRVAITTSAMQAFNEVKKLMNNSGNDRVRQVSAMDILDRAGYNKTDKIDASVSLDASEGLSNAIAASMKIMQSADKPSVYVLEPTKEELEALEAEGKDNDTEA